MFYFWIYPIMIGIVSNGNSVNSVNWKFTAFSDFFTFELYIRAHQIRLNLKFHHIEQSHIREGTSNYYQRLIFSMNRKIKLTNDANFHYSRFDRYNIRLYRLISKSEIFTFYRNWMGKYSTTGIFWKSF